MVKHIEHAGEWIIVTGEWKTRFGTHHYQSGAKGGDVLEVDIIEFGEYRRYTGEQASHLIPAAVFSEIIEASKEGK